MATPNEETLMDAVRVAHANFMQATKEWVTNPTEETEKKHNDTFTAGREAIEKLLPSTQEWIKTHSRLPEKGEKISGGGRRKSRRSKHSKRSHRKSKRRHH